MSGLAELTFLDLAENELWPEDAIALAEHFTSIICPQHLNVQGNIIGDGVKSLAASMIYLTDLQILKLLRNVISGSGLTHLDTAFFHMSFLRVWNLNEILLHTEACSKFGRGLVKLCNFLTWGTVK